jgi:hypothetical protein
MAYEFTFTPRFQKHFKGLTAQEKKQLKKNRNSWRRTPPTRRFVPSGFRAPQIFSSAAAIFSPVPLINSLPKLICLLKIIGFLNLRSPVGVSTSPGKEHPFIVETYVVDQRKLIV